MVCHTIVMSANIHSNAERQLLAPSSLKPYNRSTQYLKPENYYSPWEISHARFNFDQTTQIASLPQYISVCGSFLFGSTTGRPDACVADKFGQLQGSCAFKG